MAIAAMFESLNTTMFLAALSCLLLLVRVVTSQNAIEKALALPVFFFIVYKVWREHTREVTSESKKNLDINHILSVLREGGHEDMMLSRIASVILDKDAPLLEALLALINIYNIYDRDVVRKICILTFQFYDAYANMLLQSARPTDQEVTRVIDKRFELLEAVHSLYVSIPFQRHVKTFEHISLVIRSSTYKSVNVLKNKFNLVNAKPPYAHNYMTQNTQARL